jgi:SPP1 gp7 family putative phage head morphogenesis protein
MDLRTDIVIGKGMNRDKTERILRALDGAAEMKVMVGSGKVTFFDDLNSQAITTLKVLPSDLQIPMDLTDQQKKEMTETYLQDIETYANDWKAEAIERLREKTQKNATLGYRADRLASIVKSEFGISKSKARFIARQETSLFVSKYRELRYTGAGVKQYIWSTSQDQRVRHDHADLNHKIFSWDEPPIVDQSTGKRGNPGTDFNCRCLALPVIRLGAN